MKQSLEPVTLELLEQYLRYEHETGHLFWKIEPPKRRVKIGDRAGRTRMDHYWIVTVRGNTLFCHRVVWALHHKIWPVPHAIDHINGDPSDNRIVNLRPAAQHQNMRNRRPARTNKLGIKGVRETPQGRYQARITHSGRGIHIGHYDTVEEARAAYNAVAIQLYGEFFKPA